MIGAVESRIVMGRVSCVVAIASLSVGAAGCSISNWIPSSAPAAVTVQVESEPAGAEAKSSVGPTCRTPCTLSVATTKEFTVTFSLTAYQPQTVLVTPRPIGDPREGSGQVKFEPDPVYAQLEPAAPTKGKKKAPDQAQKTAPPPPAK
jgi:hypothetical protein